MTPDYIDTVRLLLAIAPTVFPSGRFAMKGGTALNLFVQDMPRLSIDIDVIYVDHRPDRETALKTISNELVAMKAALKAKGYRATHPTNTQGDEVKLVVGNDATQVKVEVNFVFSTASAGKSNSWTGTSPTSLATTGRCTKSSSRRPNPWSPRSRTSSPA